MIRKQILDFGRKDILAPGNDHVIVSTFDEEQAVLVEMPNVTDRHQAIDHLLRSAARIALELCAIPDEDPARRAVGDRPIVLVVDSNRRSEWRPTGRTRGRSEFRGQGDRGHGDFRRPIHVMQVVAEGIHPSQCEFAGQRGAATSHHAKRRRVIFSNDGGIERENAVQHDGDDGHRVDPMFLNRLQHAFGIEFAMKNQRVCEEIGHRKVDQTPGMEGRCADQHGFAHAVGHSFEKANGGCEAARSRGSIRTFGRTRRPRGEDGGATGLVGPWRRFRRVFACEMIESGYGGIALAPGEETLDLACALFNDLAELFIVDQGPCTFAGEDVLELWRGEPRIEEE